jgi:hypothetical protein
MTSHSTWLIGALALLASSCLTPVNDTPLGKVDGGSTGGGTAVTGGAGGAGGGNTTGGGGNATGGGSNASSVTCTTDGFCWERAPFGGTFHGVAGIGPSFVMAVGEGGVIARYDGTSWTYLRTSPGRTLRGVWFESTTRGWAVGEGGTILEWNGATWSPITSPTTKDLLALHGNGAVVYAGGIDVVLKRTNGAFEVVPNVLPVTDSQVVVRDIAVVGANDVYLAGTGSNFLRHFDGTQWAELLEPSGASGGPSSNDQLFGLDVCGGNVFVSGTFSGEMNVSWVRVNGAWQIEWQGAGRTLCLSPTEYLNFGRSSYDDRRVRHVTLGTPNTSVELATGVDFRAGWAAGARDVWLVGANGALQHWTGGPLASTDAERTARVFAFSSTNVWAVRADETVERFDGTSWLPVSIPAGVGTVGSLFSPAPDEVWLVRGSQVLHLKNGTWDFVNAVPANTQYVSGRSANDVWLSGGAGAVLQYDGTRLVTHFLGSSDNTGPVHVTATQTWVPMWSQNGTVRSYRRTTSGWQEAPRAWRIGGYGDEVYLADVALLLRWTAQQTSLVSEDMSSGWLTATSDTLFAVKSTYDAEGVRNQLVRVQGSVLTALEMGTSEPLSSLSATPDGHVWATTEGGGLLHKKP